MRDEDIQRIVQRVLVEEFELPEASIHPEAKLYEDLGLDSLDAVDLVVALERAFDFRIDRVTDEAIFRQARTVRDILDFVRTKRDAMG